MRNNMYFDDMKINVYFTHIEIYPYKIGDNEQLEKYHSVWNPVLHRHIPTSYYADFPILYLPRGMNINQLERMFPGAEVTVYKNPDEYEYFKVIETLPTPKNKIQEDAIKFLMCEDQFYKGHNYTQYGLNLDTGDGKTACMVHAICKYRMKAIIICHQTKIKKQWKKEFIDLTSVDKSDIIDIDGSEMIENIMADKVIGDIYVVNHQTISSYASDHGWTGVREFFRKIRVGIKVYDEAHKFFGNILMVDFFSNTKKTFYLTATFKKNRLEQSVFQRAFSNLYRFGEETINYKEKRRHVHYVVVKFRSRPDPEDIILMTRTPFKFSVYAYTDYAIKRDKTILRVMEKYIEIFGKLRGKILVVVAKKDSCEIVSEYIKDNCPYDKTVDYIHSSRTLAENEQALNADIIVSTMGSVGTGLNIKYLRVIINMEPHSSETNCLQLKGRLREFSPTDDTFLIDLVDISIKDIYDMYQRRRKVLEKVVKSIRECRE